MEPEVQAVVDTNTSFVDGDLELVVVGFGKRRLVRPKGDATRGALRRPGFKPLVILEENMRNGL
jgi:hypothetical protein